MQTLDTAIRLAVIGQELLIAAVFLFGNGRWPARISGVLLMLSIMGYLYTSSAVLRNSLPLVSPFAMLLAIVVPHCLWLFARAVFEAPWPRAVFTYTCVLIGVVAWGVVLTDDVLSTGWTSGATDVTRVLGLIIVAHALWLTLKGRLDDLIERRRTFRLFFVVIISVQVAAVLVAEIILDGASAPAWLDLTNVIVIAVITMSLAVPMLRLNFEFLGPAVTGERDGIVQEEQSPGFAKNVYREKLLQLMADGYYREPGLTIPALAENLSYPEYQLRRLINGRMGYRNFSAFLNHYRVAEARKQLVDPERIRVSVLTIALDLGYASIGPFNRAFKEATGMTPTDYRRRNTK